MNNNELKQKLTIKLLKPRVIGWITLIVSLLMSPVLGTATGFLLATIDWYRMRAYWKASSHLILGIALAISNAIVLYIFNNRFPVPSTWLFVGYITILFLYIFAIVSYLHVTISKDITQFEKTHNVQPASILLAISIAAITSIVMVIVGNRVNYLVALALTPKIKAASTFIPESNYKIVGQIYPWTDEPIQERRLVLCELYEETPLVPYDCKLTNLTTITNKNGEFHFEKVPNGTYLVFYNSGVDDFNREAAETDFYTEVERWNGQVIKLGNTSWLLDRKFFNYQGEDFIIFSPAGEKRHRFYYDHVGLTLMAGRSQFIVAHDIEKVISSNYVSEFPPRVPDRVYVPTMIEVVDGHTSQIGFDVLYLGNR